MTGRQKDPRAGERQHLRAMWCGLRPVEAIVEEMRGLGWADAEISAEIAKVAGGVPRTLAAALGRAAA